jgi:hypothetical protein
MQYINRREQYHQLTEKGIFTRITKGNNVKKAQAIKHGMWDHKGVSNGSIVDFK